MSRFCKLGENFINFSFFFLQFLIFHSFYRNRVELVTDTMSDYFEELGHTPTGPEGANDFDKHYKRLQILAIMNGIDMEIEVPEASKRAILALPVHEIAEDDPHLEDESLECAVCKQPAVAGDKYKILPCKHEFHEECILLWLKKVGGTLFLFFKMVSFKSWTLFCF